MFHELLSYSVLQFLVFLFLHFMLYNMFEKEVISFNKVVRYLFCTNTLIPRQH